MTISGSNFGETQNTGFVWLGTALGVVTSWTDSQIIANRATEWLGVKTKARTRVRGLPGSHRIDMNLMLIGLFRSKWSADVHLSRA